MSKQIYILMGPSASGKTTLGRYLQLIGIEELVSHTTRDKRMGEEDGVTYYFINKEQFDELDKVESTEYAGNHYCLSRGEIDRKLELNDKVFVIMDRNGAEEFLATEYGEYIKIVYICCNYWDMFKRIYDREGLFKAIERTIWAVRTGEMSNDDIADKIIRNNDGRLKDSKEELYKFIFKN